MSEGKKAVREFMTVIAIGQAVYTAAICLGFLITGRFSLSVLLGALYGSAAILLYYFLFARATAKAADESDPEAAKKRIQASYSLRMLLLALLIGAGLFLSTDYSQIKIFHWLPVIASVIMPRISIALWQIIHRHSEQKNTDASKRGDGSDGN